MGEEATAAPTCVDVASLTGLFGITGVARFGLASDLVRQPLTKYLVQRWLFGTEGGLAVPFHQRVLQLWPWLAPAMAVATLVLVSVFFVRRAPQSAVRAAVAFAAWTLLGSLPTLPFFFVAPDLQGARYLYLPAIGYAMLLVVMGQDGRIVRSVGVVVLTLAVVGGAAASRVHQQMWQGAAEVRDRLLAAVGRDNEVRRCTKLWIEGVPDTENGAFVFRNGAEIALQDLGVALSKDAPLQCRFEWSGNSLAKLP